MANAATVRITARPIANLSPEEYRRRIARITQILRDASDRREARRALATQEFGTVTPKTAKGDEFPT